MPIVPEFEKLRQEDDYKLKASLIYIMSSYQSGLSKIKIKTKTNSS